MIGNDALLREMLLEGLALAKTPLPDEPQKPKRRKSAAVERFDWTGEDVPIVELEIPPPPPRPECPKCGCKQYHPRGSVPVGAGEPNVWQAKAMCRACGCRYLVYRKYVDGESARRERRTDD
ncbi:MAG: hypothetical protein K8T25_01975 [Planctomycetia bacterium]|nr:hypothetical protein [Planctomycetia bacterium]